MVQIRRSLIHLSTNCRAYISLRPKIFKMRSTKKLAWSILLIITIVVILASCSTTSKTKSIVKTSVDSSSVTKIDSNTVKSIDSISVKKANTITNTEVEDNYTKVTVIEYDTTDFTRLSIMWDSMDHLFKTPAADYFPSIKQPIKKITISETGIKKERTNIVQNKSDSTKLSKNDNIELTKTTAVDLHKTETVKNKEVHRTSYWGWLWLLLLIPAYVIYRNWDKIKLALKIV